RRSRRSFGHRRKPSPLAGGGCRSEQCEERLGEGLPCDHAPHPARARGARHPLPQGEKEICDRANEGKNAAARQSAGRRQAGAVRGCLSRSASLLAQLGPVFETLFDLAFEAALRRIVELLATERFPKLILA